MRGLQEALPGAQKCPGLSWVRGSVGGERWLAVGSHWTSLDSQLPHVYNYVLDTELRVRDSS